MDAQIALQAAGQSDPWAWGWEAVASVATAATLVAGGAVFIWDKVRAAQAARQRRRVLASGLIHPLQLLKGFLTAAKPILERAENFQDDPKAFGEALLGHEGAQVGKHAASIVELGEEAACDFAYAVSLVATIDAWATWLTKAPSGLPTVEGLKKASEFHVEAIDQILESIETVEKRLKENVPTHILKRRHGPDMK